MSEGPDNLVLQILRRIEARLGRVEECLDTVVENVRDMSVRLFHVERNQTGLQRRQDRFDQRVERMERRLDLIGGPPGVRE